MATCHMRASFEPTACESGPPGYAALGATPHPEIDMFIKRAAIPHVVYRVSNAAALAAKPLVRGVTFYRDAPLVPGTEDS